jgi:hypothetical protein
MARKQHYWIETEFRSEPTPYFSVRNNGKQDVQISDNGVKVMRISPGHEMAVFCALADEFDPEGENPLSRSGDK